MSMCMCLCLLECLPPSLSKQTYTNTHTHKGKQSAQSCHKFPPPPFLRPLKEVGCGVGCPKDVNPHSLYRAPPSVLMFDIDIDWKGIVPRACLPAWSIIGCSKRCGEGILPRMIKKESTTLCLVLAFWLIFVCFFFFWCLVVSVFRCTRPSIRKDPVSDSRLPCSPRVHQLSISWRLMGDKFVGAEDCSFNAGQIPSLLSALDPLWVALLS